LDGTAIIGGGGSSRRLRQNNLRRARVAAKLTQETPAERAGINPRTIQKIEVGDINFLVTTVCRIHAALGCR